MQKKKALLITSPNLVKNNFWTCSTTSPIGSIMPPADLAYVAAYLRTKNIEPKIRDLRFERDPYGCLEREINGWTPDAVLFNVGTASVGDLIPIIRFLRRTVPNVVAFGFHAMAMPEEMFENGVTHILYGDPEYAAEKAIAGEKHQQKGVLTSDHRNPQPGWIEPLDEIPYAALDLVDNRKYHSLIMGNDPFTLLLANRGCYYHCPYCTIPFQFGHRVRTQSVPRVIGEIERDSREFGIKSFFFIDSAINLRPEWTASLCEEIIRMKLEIRWCSNMRIPPVTRELLELMKRAGCFRLFYGVEDLDLLRELKRKTSLEETKKAFKETREAGIESVAFIVLFPGIDENENSMAKRLLKMLDEIKPDAIQCNVAIPYPGCDMYAEYKNKFGLCENWELYDPAGEGYPYRSQVDLVKVRKKIYYRFYMKNPAYVWKTLLRIDRTSLVRFIQSSARLLLKDR